MHSQQKQIFLIHILLKIAVAITILLINNFIFLYLYHHVTEDNFNNFKLLIDTMFLFAGTVGALFLLSTWLLVFKYWQTSYELSFLFRMDTERST